jgi:tRNA pseudouridine32 synthase/23S rRNA pseudouridine746 synthase
VPVLKFDKHIVVHQQRVIVDLLAEETGLSKTVLKDCLNKGAIWLKRSGKKEQRIRKAKFTVRPKDHLSVYFDPEVLGQPVPEPDTIANKKDYSIWNKPAGLLSQGTRYGDHCSLLRVAEKKLDFSALYLVHRLDREAQGLVLLAHNKNAAALFSKLFSSGNIEKKYRAIVHGLLGEEGAKLDIHEVIDGKAAHTIATVAAHDNEQKRTILDIQLKTGRYHQIRRHLSGLGHPLVGDYRYGGARGKEKLQLVAYKLTFNCPFTKQYRVYSLDEA